MEHSCVVSGFEANYWRSNTNMNASNRPCGVLRKSLLPLCSNWAPNIGCRLAALLIAFASSSLSSGPLISNALTVLLTRGLIPEGCAPATHWMWSRKICCWIKVAGKALLQWSTGWRSTSANVVKLFSKSLRKPRPLGGGLSDSPLSSNNSYGT